MTRLANSSGAGFERACIDALRHSTGFPEMSHREWISAGSPRPAIVTNSPYRNIYGSVRSRSEAVVRGLTPDTDARVECKWQVVPGSVDEKFPLVIENARNVDEPTVIIVTGGGGARKEAVEWMRNAAAFHGNGSILVFTSSDELRRWLQQGSPWAA